MALLFPWATKEYLLWEMSLGQIVMYHNIGIELKYGTGTHSKGKTKTLVGASHAELVRARAEARRQLGIPEDGDLKAAYRERYGDID